mmetsp:Transcript_34106/g.80912  ORF Transcript_34106/g.80912 Transcript_34106/m.80912 type:complete len:205 (-) Transcript_34106:239-853(-)
MTSLNSIFICQTNALGCLRGYSLWNILNIGKHIINKPVPSIRNCILEFGYHHLGAVIQMRKKIYLNTKVILQFCQYLFDISRIASRVIVRYFRAVIIQAMARCISNMHKESGALRSPLQLGYGLKSTENILSCITTACSSNALDPSLPSTEITVCGNVLETDYFKSACISIISVTHESDSKLYTWIDSANHLHNCLESTAYHCN